MGFTLANGNVAVLSGRTTSRCSVRGARLGDQRGEFATGPRHHIQQLAAFAYQTWGRVEPLDTITIPNDVPSNVSKPNKVKVKVEKRKIPRFCPKLSAADSQSLGGSGMT